MQIGESVAQTDGTVVVVELLTHMIQVCVLTENVCQMIDKDCGEEVDVYYSD